MNSQWSLLKENTTISCCSLRYYLSEHRDKIKRQQDKDNKSSKFIGRDPQICGLCHEKHILIVH